MKSNSVDRGWAGNANVPGMSLRSVLLWMPPVLLLVLALGAFWTRQVWLPAFVERNETTEVHIGGLRISLRRPWVATNLSDSHFALSAEYLEGRLLTTPRAVELDIRRYDKPNPEIVLLAQQEPATITKIHLKLGDVNYEQARTVILGGEKGVRLVGTNSGSVFLRFDFPSSRVALEFLTDRREGVEFLEEMIGHTVSYSPP